MHVESVVEMARAVLAAMECPTLERSSIPAESAVAQALTNVESVEALARTLVECAKATVLISVEFAVATANLAVAATVWPSQALPEINVESAVVMEPAALVVMAFPTLAKW